MSDLNDKELFENAIADTPAEPETPAETPVETAAEPEEQPRDERGRFAPKADEPEPVVAQAPEPAPKQETEAHVPSWRLREVNEAREAAERRAQETEARFAEMQRQFAAMQAQLQAKPQEPVDWYADPNAAIRQTIDPVKSEFQTALEGMKFQFSETIARQSLGDAKFEEIKKWAHTKLGDPVLSARIERSPHPWGELAKSYDEQKTLSEIGGDVSTFKNKILEEAMKDPAFQAKVIEAAKAQAAGQVPGTKPNTVVQLPPSINRATSAASPHEEVGDLSNASLYAAAIR